MIRIMNKINRTPIRVCIVGILIALSVMVTLAGAAPATLAADGAEGVQPGNNTTVTFTAANTGTSESGYILNVSAPNDWNITAQSADGGTWNSAESKWLWQTVNANESVRPSVTLHVPDNASETNYSIRATLLSSDGTEAVTTQEITVQNSTTSEPTPKPSGETATVNISTSEDEISPNTPVTVTAELTNTGVNSKAYILDLSVPSNWTIISKNNDGGTWKAKNNTWLWQTIQPSDSVSPSITLQAPKSANNEKSTIEATAKSTDWNQTVIRSISVTQSDSLVPFSETARLSSDQLKNNSLSGKISVEQRLSSNTSADILRSSPTNYSITLTAPDNAENITFYLQANAISTSQNVNNLTMYLDGDQHQYSVKESAGPGNSPWIAFNIPHFSTRTVSFISNSNEGAGGGAGAGGGGGAGGMPGNQERTAQVSLFDLEGETTVRLSEIPRSGSADINTSAAVTGGPFDLTRVSMNFVFDSPDFRFEITDPRAESGAAPTLPNTVATPIGFMELDAIGADPTTVEQTQLTLALNDGAVPAGASSTDLTVYQYVDNEWQPVSTSADGNMLTATLATHAAEYIAVGVETSQPDTETQDSTNTDDTNTTDSDSDSNTTTADDQSDDQPDTDTADDGDGADVEVPGFGPIPSIAALLAILLYSRLRRHQ